MMNDLRDLELLAKYSTLKFRIKQPFALDRLNNELINKEIDLSELAKEALKARKSGSEKNDALIQAKAKLIELRETPTTYSKICQTVRRSAYNNAIKVISDLLQGKN